MANWTVGKIIVLALLAHAPAAHAIGACDAQKQIHVRHAPFAIGDSVLLGAADALARAGFSVDARGCRQMKAGLDILAHRRLPRVVIVELGTNWVVTPADTRRALRILGPRRKLILVTPRIGADAGDARVMRAAARRHPHRVCIADWARYSRGRSDWAPGDGIHLSESGIRAFVRLLVLTTRRPGPCGGPTTWSRWRPRRR
jgi:hypothetical protein